MLYQITFFYLFYRFQKYYSVRPTDWADLYSEFTQNFSVFLLIFFFCVLCLEMSEKCEVKSIKNFNFFFSLSEF